jgi:CCR4-NOT transcription complex subunit 2
LNVEPGYYLPACYRNVQATPPAHQRMRTFSDEILFYVFYCMPKDIAQEAAAQELYVTDIG